MLYVYVCSPVLLDFLHTDLFVSDTIDCARFAECVNVIRKFCVPSLLKSQMHACFGPICFSSSNPDYKAIRCPGETCTIMTSMVKSVINVCLIRLDWIRYKRFQISLKGCPDTFVKLFPKAQKLPIWRNVAVGTVFVIFSDAWHPPPHPQ